MRNTLIRSLTGLFIIAFILLPILAVRITPFVYTGVFALIVFFSMHEFYGLIEKHEGIKLQRITASTGGVVLFLTLAWHIFFNLPLFFAAIAGLIFTFVMIRELYLKKEKPFLPIAYTMLGLLWIALPLSLFSFLFINTIYEGSTYIPAVAFFVFMWVYDSGAYIVGLLTGRKKLFERISPKKTWEGVWGGLFFVLLAAYIISLYWTGLPLWVWMTAALITAVCGTFGDLTESLFKRSIGCKDSGNIMPGHGGFMDRFDGFYLAVLPYLLWLSIYNFIIK